jgi:hypothetical protein
MHPASMSWDLILLVIHIPLCFFITFIANITSPVDAGTTHHSSAEEVSPALQEVDSLSSAQLEDASDLLSKLKQAVAKPLPAPPASTP